MIHKLRLFSVGPVNMYDYTLDLSAKQIPYFRTNEFSQIVFKINQNIKKMLGAEENVHIALLTASGTGAMEAVVQTLDKNQKVLIINGGSFGDRFEKLAILHNQVYDVINLDFEQDLTEEILDIYQINKYQALLVNIHETSIGKYYAQEILKSFCHKNGCYLIIDAISSFLADEFDMTAVGADIVILSSQKALALYPGLSMVAISNRYFKERIENRKVSCAYLDLFEALKDAKRGQTPYTPALNIIYQLEQRLDKINDNGGASSEILHSKILAKYFRKEIVKLGYCLPKFNFSNCLTTIICPKNNAMVIFEKCKNEYNIFLTPCGGENKNKLLRIGHLGNLEIEDYDFLLNILKEKF